MRQLSRASAVFIPSVVDSRERIGWRGRRRQPSFWVWTGPDKLRAVEDKEPVAGVVLCRLDSALVGSLDLTPIKTGPLA